VFENLLGQGNQIIIEMSSFFEKLLFRHVFRPHENENPAFSNSSGLKSVSKSSVFVTD